MCEHDEVSASIAGGRVWRGTSGAAQILACSCAQEVDATATVRLLGSEGVLAAGLSQALRAAGRRAQFGGRHRTEKRSTLHDRSQGRAAAADGAACAAA